MLIKKEWDHVIEVKEEFVSRKRKNYISFQEKREKRYISSSKNN